MGLGVDECCWKEVSMKVGGLGRRLEVIGLNRGCEGVGRGGVGKMEGEVRFLVTI